MLSDWKFSVIKLKTWEGYTSHSRSCAQIIHVGNRHSPPSKVLYDVPQGSVLGPVLYVLYTSDVARLGEALGLGAHLYADDTQLYGHCSLANSFELASRVLRAIDSIHEWMSSNRLSLNTGKTQFIWLGTKHSVAKRDADRLFSLLPSLTELSSMRNLTWLHYRSRVKHEGPNHQTLPVVLLPASSNTHGSTLTYIISHPNAGPCLHLHASRFLQQPSLWDKYLPPWPSTIGCNSAWPSLAPGSVPYSTQA